MLDPPKKSAAFKKKVQERKQYNPSYAPIRTIPPRTEPPVRTLPATEPPVRTLPLTTDVPETIAPTARNAF